MAEHRSRVQGMSLNDILRFRTRKPFNLPTDPNSYPRFLSFESRHDYLIRELLRTFFTILNRQQRDVNGESDSSGEDESDRILAETGSIDESDEEYEMSKGEADYERSRIMETMQDAMKFLDLGMYGGRGLRGRAWHGLHGGRGRGQQSSRRGRMHEAEHVEIPEEYSDLGRKRELHITNLRYPPEASASTSNPERAKRRRVEDPDTDTDTAESTAGNRGVMAANSIEPTSAPGENMVWPKFERPRAFNTPADEGLRTRRMETTPGRNPRGEPSSWADVYRMLPAISGGDLPGPQEFRVKQEQVKQTTVGNFPPHRMARIRTYVADADVAFVGEQYPMHKFSPFRGDLIIVPREGGRPEPSYLESYMGEGAMEERRFSTGELVLRIGHFNMFASMLIPNDFEYEPYSWISIFAFNPMATNPTTRWKFLGSQGELDDAQISHPPYESQGKFLEVGSQVLHYTQFEPIVPRRGDVIIKREAWDPNYNHNVNFWYSMVKWHRGTQFSFVAGDMLVRRFIDNQYDEQKTSNIARNPLLWGWAEMYEYHDFQNSAHNWIFWGRTQHLYDKPVENQAFEVIKCTCDLGLDDENDIDHDMVNPRR